MSLGTSAIGRSIRRAVKFVRLHDASDMAAATALTLRTLVPRYRHEIVGNIPPLLRTDVDVARVAWLEHRWQHETFDRGVVPRRGAAAAGRGYWICMTPRSGSTYLARLLTGTGVLGRPMEYLNVESAYRKASRAADFATYLGQVREDAGTPNGVHGIKVAYDHILHFMQRGLMPSPGDRYLYVTREDLLLQGISFYRAEQSGVWTSPSPRSPRPVKFDAVAIWEYVDALVRMMAQWERFFAYHDITPLRLTYERIEADPRAAVVRTAELLDVAMDPASVDPEVRVRRQRDETSLEWAQRARSA